MNIRSSKNSLKLIITFLLFIHIAFLKLANAVPVVSNEVVVYGTVLEYSIIPSKQLSIKPDQQLYKLSVSAEEVKDINYKWQTKFSEG